jgi:hypothetical protein
MPANLGLLAPFTGTFGGTNTSSGLNMITVPSKNGPVLKIHRIREELKFISEQGLFGIPMNRGSVEDITVTPILYDQYVADNDVPEVGANLTSGLGVLHQEAGMFLLNSASTSPKVAASVQRLGSLPHGVSFNAQGFITTVSGPPIIAPVSTTPFVTATKAPAPVAAASATDAAKFPAATVSDPTKLLRGVIAGQKILSTAVVATDTDPTYMVGGGVTNSAFLLGNVECRRVRSTFFLEKVSGWFGPQDQIQYVQEVFLEIGEVTYPHVTVATLTRDPFPTPIIF